MISYDPLSKTLEKNKMTVYDLENMLDNFTLRSILNTGRYITFDTLDKICIALHCKVEDVVVQKPGEHKVKDRVKAKYVMVNWQVLKDKYQGKNWRAISKQLGRCPTYLNTLMKRDVVNVRVVFDIAKKSGCTAEELVVKE